MSGLTESVDGVMYLCQKGTGTPTWSAGLKEKRSPLTLADGWAKAVKTGMTAAFGVIKNPTSKAITVVGAASPLSAVVQLHEVVSVDGSVDGSMVMQEKAGGFTIPAGGSITLQPGGNHLMLMRVRKAIKAGSMVPVTLITADGGLLTIKVLAKTFTGANEEYDPGMAGTG